MACGALVARTSRPPRETTLHTACSTALFLFLTPALGAPQSSVDCACHATNARYNVSGQPKTGYDFIPVVPDDSLGFYVIYSARQNEYDPTLIGSTACIYALPLMNEEVLIFGAGWGDTNWAGWAFYDADYDVTSLDEAIRSCMGLDPARVRLRFVTPHGHCDHLNVAFIKALERAGYRLAEIAYHEGDRAWIEQLPWQPQHPALFHVLDALPCGSELVSYDSALGHIWFTQRPGHTPGSIDLVLDVANDPTNRVLVRGSLAGGDCPDPSGVFMDLDAHGTAIIGGSRRAQVTVLDGTGINPPCLSSLRPPRLGSLWPAQVDASAHLGATAVFLVGADCLLDPGLLTGYGELLLNTMDGPLLSLAQPSSGALDLFSVPIPNDSSFMGVVFYVQATILGGGPELCNALQLVIGF